MRIGLAQMNIAWEDKEKNKAKCIIFLEKAKEKKVDLLLFPEMSLTGFSMNVLLLGETLEHYSETVTWFSAQAKLYGLCIGFGFIEKPSSSEKGRNNYFIVSPAGTVISKYSKIHPFSFGTESKFYTGGNTLPFFQLDDFTISTFICYDLRFPEIFQVVSKRSALITIGANWPEARREHWITLLKARAIENQCYIAGINRVGVGDNIKYSGDSMIVDPLGNVLTTDFNNETLITSDIDIDEVTKLRKNFRLKADRREDLYYFLNNQQ